MKESTAIVRALILENRKQKAPRERRAAICEGDGVSLMWAGMFDQEENGGKQRKLSH